MSKGISPLIAAVLLIAFTMAIAGILAFWAKTFVGGELESIGLKGACIGALDVFDISFNEGNVSIRIRNNNDEIKLSDIRADFYYTDVRKGGRYYLKDYGATDPLPPLETTYAIITTGDPTEPRKIEVFSGNCPDYKIIVTKFS